MDSSQFETVYERIVLLVERGTTSLVEMTENWGHYIYQCYMGRKNMTTISNMDDIDAIGCCKLCTITDSVKKYELKTKDQVFLLNVTLLDLKPSECILNIQSGYERNSEIEIVTIDIIKTLHITKK